MTLHNRKLKTITFDLGGNEFQCQISQWQLTNNTEDGEKLYSMCPDGEAIEETDPDWSLDLTFYSDWTLNGISDYLMSNDGQDVTFTLNHHEGIVGEHVQWTGTVRIKAPNIGGEVKTTETQQVTFRCIGVPAYSRPA